MKNIYKAGFIALVATPLFGLFSQNTYAIMPSTFNDENFYNCVVSNFSSQYPDEVIAQSGLTNEQLGKMSSLDCSWRNITDTTGLELMTSLTNLNLFGNQLTSIDLSKNVNLTKLELGYNQLTSIDVSKNVNLTTLKLDFNQLTSIDVSKNVNLTELNLTYNQLTSIDVSKNVNLTGLNLFGNQLASIDVSKNVNLTALDLSYNQLTSIDVSKNVNLEILGLSANKLTSVDVSKNTELRGLSANNDYHYRYGVSGENALSSIDLSNNSKIESLDLRMNPIETLDISNNPDLRSLYLSYPRLEEEYVYVTYDTIVTGANNIITTKENNGIISYNLAEVKFLNKQNYPPNAWLFLSIINNNDDDDNDDDGPYFPEEELEEEYYSPEEKTFYISEDKVPAYIGVDMGAMYPDGVGDWKVGFILELPQPESDQEGSSTNNNEDSLIVPNTGTQIEDSNNSKALFPILGMLLGIMTILFGMSLRSSYKRNEYK
ncbi:leucine-rich repeat domain-containing protein [Candidatus Saccharibacteria bacterium]|nr:leucine-rich repeat domain-containing protein [Candidatus Saccharibacteria bacterium]